MNFLSFRKVGFLGLLQFSAAAFAAASPGPDAGARPVMRLDDLLWRDVQNAKGESLGSVSDVLVHLPSGRIAFVAVRTHELFDRPKVVAPEALMFGDTPDAPLRLELADDQWLNAPELEWNAQRVIATTMDGARVLGYHQGAWLPPVVGEAGDNEPADEERLAAPPTQPGSGDAEQYVSLSELVLDRVVTPATEQPGFMRDFVLDWTTNRATYALVSPRFTPAVEPNEMWFAIPVALLAPPVDLQAITVSSDEATFRGAQQAPEVAALPEENRTQVYLYPVAEEENAGDVAARETDAAPDRQPTE